MQCRIFVALLLVSVLYASCSGLPPAISMADGDEFITTNLLTGRWVLVFLAHSVAVRPCELVDTVTAAGLRDAGFHHLLVAPEGFDAEGNGTTGMTCLLMPTGVLRISS